MRQICHLPKTLEGLDKANKRGLRYYHTVCGTVAAMQNLGPKEMCDCGACLILSDKTAEASLDPAGIDLSDWGDIGALDEPEKGPLPPWEMEPASPQNCPTPSVVSYDELCTRLGIDPEADPKGRLGSLGVDVRSVLTKEERAKATPILSMVKSLPIGEPLVQMVFRLCHELAWHRELRASSFELRAAKHEPNSEDKKK